MASAAPLPNSAGPDQLARLTGLLNSAERDVKVRFLQLVRDSRGLRTLEQLATLVEAGRIDEALDFMDEFGSGLTSSINQAYAEAGLSTAATLRRQTGSMLEFNALSPRGVSALTRENARLIRELTQQQRAATLEALTDGVRRGLRPDQIARGVRDSIGLTARQQRAVSNYRRLLEEGNSEALQRQLRDRRFDSTVRRAVRDGDPLSARQIDRMVDRYRERSLALRSRTIANTEALRAINMGDTEMWQQAIDAGIVDPEAITSVWITASDERVRESHQFMQGQEQPFGTPFNSGNGNKLRFPGDPNAPGNDTINCRCVVRRTIPKQDAR